MNTVAKSKFSVLSMTQIAVCTALLCVSAWMSIALPFIEVAFTLQVLMVLLVSLLLKPVYALTAQVLYTLLGVVGLPVFSKFASGVGAIVSSRTGGFIIGFIIASFLVSLLKGSKIIDFIIAPLPASLLKYSNIIRYIIVSIFVGLPAIYIPGILGYMLYTGADLISATVTLTSVFILLDIVKCVIASFAAVLIKKALNAANLGFEE